MIYYDVTKTGSASHRSGLIRVGTRLRQELGGAAVPVVWSDRRRTFVAAGADVPVPLTPADWLLTAELFSEAERPGFWDFLRAKPCRRAAIFHDAIPLKLADITWPQSVARHPEYMKMLASFDRVWANSVASREDLLGWWRWIGLDATPPVDVLALGADFSGAARGRGRPAAGLPALLMVGILEPRKNQTFLLEVCAGLWGGGLEFDLHLVGRVNPHFGKPVLAAVRRWQKRWPGLHYHAAADDRLVEQLYGRVRAAVFPTIAEGCGLPLLEALWQGVPVVCSDLPVLRENADAGGCLCAAVNDPAAWSGALRRVLTEAAVWAQLQTEAVSRPLPVWSEAAAVLRRGLR